MTLSSKLKIIKFYTYNYSTHNCARVIVFIISALLFLLCTTSSDKFGNFSWGEWLTLRIISINTNTYMHKLSLTHTHTHTYVYIGLRIFSLNMHYKHNAYVLWYKWLWTYIMKNMAPNCLIIHTVNVVDYFIIMISVCLPYNEMYSGNRLPEHQYQHYQRQGVTNPLP